MIETINKLKNKIGSICKSHKKLLIFIVCLLIVIVVLVFIFSKQDYIVNSPIDAHEEKFKDEYEKLNNVVNEDGKEYPKVNIPANNNIKYKNNDEIVNIFKNNEDAVIYFGYPSCLYCRSAIQVLFDAAKDTELEIINYLDVEDETINYNDLIQYLDDEFIVTENNVKKIYSPLVLFVVNGEVVSYNKGTLFSQEDPYTKLDESQISGLSEIYKYGINDVITSINLKNNSNVSDSSNS